jgi:hypothetical protein
MNKAKKYKKIQKNIENLIDLKFAFLSLGNIAPDKSRILLLIVSIIFTATIVVFQQKAYVAEEKVQVIVKAPVLIKKEDPVLKELNELVKGYPIAEMTPYIAKQEPKVAAFLIAIAKKESAWGKRRPVLNGKDCYNYWGFRMKAEKMGSGGHTCFDTPQEAVEAVASRIDQMVNEEKIDTPKDMIVWKCGYGCQNKPKTWDEKKWIKDVNMYYEPMMN